MERPVSQIPVTRPRPHRRPEWTLTLEAGVRFTHETPEDSLLRHRAQYINRFLEFRIGDGPHEFFRSRHGRPIRARHSQEKGWRGVYADPLRFGQTLDHSPCVLPAAQAS